MAARTPVKVADSMVAVSVIRVLAIAPATEEADPAEPVKTADLLAVEKTASSTKKKFNRNWPKHRLALVAAVATKPVKTGLSSVVKNAVNWPKCTKATPKAT